MKQIKKWYDYLWVVSLTYLILDRRALRIYDSFKNLMNLFLRQVGKREDKVVLFAGHHRRRFYFSVLRGIGEAKPNGGIGN